MKVVFIAGPFRGANPWEVENNIREAETLSFRVWEVGMAALCPHTNTRFFDKALPDELFLTGIKEMLRRCDAMLLTHRWIESEGAKAERDYALELGIPVFRTLRELDDWNKRTPDKTH